MRQINTEAIEKHNLFPLVPLEGYKKYPTVSFATDHVLNHEVIIHNLDELKQRKGITGVSLITGKVSGIVVVDLDNHSEDAPGVKNFSEVWQNVPETLVIETPGNGLHLFYKYREGLDDDETGVWPGVDILTDQHLVAAPGSKAKRKDGTIREYKVAIDLPIAEMPNELFQLIIEKQRENRDKNGKNQKIKKTQSGRKGQAKNGRIVEDEEFKEGERHDKLFRVGLRQFSKSVERDIEIILDYIISLNNEKCKPPIDDKKELESIAESICKYYKDRIYDPDDKIMPILLVNYLMSQRPLFVRGNFVFMYDDKKGVYELEKDSDIHKIYLANCIVPADATARKAKAFSELLLMVARDDVPDYPEKDFINCLDGVLNWHTGELFPHHSKYRLISQVRARWNSVPMDFENSRFKKFLDNILDRETQKTLQEGMGLMLSPHAQEVQTSFCFLGNGSNGKSKLMDIMSQLIGQQNISSVGFSKFSGEFDLSSMEGKFVNMVYDDDLTEASGKIGAAFKSVICGEPVNVNRKNKDHLPMQFNITHYFGLNVMPSVREKSHGIFRRIAILPFNKTFGSEEDVASGKADCVRDSNITKEILEKEMGLIFRWSVEGLKRLEANGFNLTVSESSKQEMEDYKRESDSAYQFLQEEIEEAPGHRIYASDVINAYNLFCDCNGIKPMDGRNLGKRLKALGVRQTRTNTARCYLDIKIRGKHDLSKPFIEGFELIEGGLSDGKASTI